MSLVHQAQTTGEGHIRRLWPAVAWTITSTTIALWLFLLTGCQAGAVPVAASSDPEPDLVLPVSTPTSNVAPSVTLALLGDVMLGRDVHPSAETFAYLEPFLGSADLVAANLESPLTRAPAQTDSPYVLCAPPEHARLLADARFDLLTLANNHILDCGEKGMLETQSALTAAGLGFAGPGLEPEYREINGIQLAFLAFDATGEFNLGTAKQAVRAAYDMGSIVIVSIHWGAEYQSGASQSQKEIATQLVEAGASLIWGHHPHVLQPVEWKGDGWTLVLYSLGNALFDQYGLANTRQSALVLVTLDPDGVTDFRAIPFMIDVPNSRIIEADPVSAQDIMRYFK
jgi:poly-gamma-glutamate synthesis protein (capsule biosynthesis protein)